MRKRRGTKFTIPSKYLLLILTTVCIIMMAVTFTTDFIAEPLSNVAGFVIAPFQKGISKVGTWMTERSDELVQIRDILKENKELKDQVDALTIEINGLQQDKYELSSLRELFALGKQYEEYEKIGATIIGSDSGNWFNTFTIDKGTNNNIDVDCNVISGSGLVGRVTKVTNNTATVISIIDDRSKVSGEILSTTDRLNVSGDLVLMNEGKIRFSHLKDPENNVKVGDKVVTSHISDKYLPGILIGYINEMTPDENNLTISGTLVPAVDFAHMKEVLVILDKKQQIEE